ncbi:MAG: hypothetical protein OHK0039_39150 [Bacteroidia bacterium]
MFVFAPVQAQDLYVSASDGSLITPRPPGELIRDASIYRERWDTLSQIRFWQRIMHLPQDSSLINIAHTREIIAAFPTTWYDKRSDEGKRAFKDSIIDAHCLSTDTRLYVTEGKQYYYKFDDVVPDIKRAIPIFREQETDPWFAQAILLIESPGALRRSPTGAYGPFQLMKYVATSQGLVVNSKVDERSDFEKSAKAAASYLRKVCIPQAHELVRSYGLSYSDSDTWFRLLVLHIYHAGAGNVRGVLSQIQPQQGGIPLMLAVWRTEYKGFRNASQNYSQIALASLVELDRLTAPRPIGPIRPIMVPYPAITTP